MSKLLRLSVCTLLFVAVLSARAANTLTAQSDTASGASSVSLAWTADDPIYQVATYNVYDNGQLIASTAATDYTAPDLAIGAHRFVVTAVNATGESPASNAVDYTVALSLPLPPAPGDLHSTISGLANISTRAQVGRDDNVLIGGFIITGATTRVIIRAIGPTLTNFGVGGALIDPTLELHGANGEILFSNDNWSDTQRAELQASGLAPTDYRESAIIADLPPGAYTAIIRGKNNTTGVALVEVYHG